MISLNWKYGFNAFNESLQRGTEANQLTNKANLLNLYLYKNINRKKIKLIKLRLHLRTKGCTHRSGSSGKLKKKTLDWSALCLQFAAAQHSGILDLIIMNIALHGSSSAKWDALPAKRARSRLHRFNVIERFFQSSRAFYWNLLMAEMLLLSHRNQQPGRTPM